MHWDDGAPWKTGVQCSCRLKIKDSRKKKIKGLQKTGQALHIFACGWQSLSPTEVPWRCSPSCLITRTYPRKTDYRHFSLFPRSVSSITPRAPTGNQMGHSLTQRHLLFPLLPGHNKGGSETSRILDCYFAVCQIIKTQKSHQTPSDKKDFLNKGFVI